MNYSQQAIDRAKLLRANCREALIRGDKDPKTPMDEALDFFRSSYACDKFGTQEWREVIKILSETKHEAN